MTTLPPPSRYKVVERGRRLEVIDTHTGKPASHAPVAAEPGKPHTGSAGIDSDSFTTRAWFDDRAPRTIRVNYVIRARLLSLRWGLAIAVALFVALLFLFWPLAVMLIFALVSGPKLRAQLRAASTRWLDQAARDSSSNG